MSKPGEWTEGERLIHFLAMAGNPDHEAVEYYLIQAHLESWGIEESDACSRARG